MIEAMYGIEFVSNVTVNNGGYGVVVLETGRVLGGDSSFTYIGSYEAKNGRVTAKVKCNNDRKLLPSVFGNFDVFTLQLEGNVGDFKELVLQGHMVEHPNMKIGIKLTRRAELP